MLKVDRGEVSEWSNVHAWKACVVKSNRGFKSRPLRQRKRKPTNTRLAFFYILFFDGVKQYRLVSRQAHAVVPN